MRAPELGRHPHRRRRGERARPVGENQPAHHDREHRREEREVGDERGVDEHRDPPLHAAVHRHDQGDPVERAGEVDDAGDQPEQKRRRSDRPRVDGRAPGDNATSSGARPTQASEG
jgi:hypothetical protein